MVKLKTKIKRIVSKNKTKIVVIITALLASLFVFLKIGKIPGLIFITITGIFITLYPFIKDKLKTKKGRKKLGRFILLGGAAIGLIILVFFGILTVYIMITAPNFNPENLYRKESTIIYDQDNEVITKLGMERREKVSYDVLPQVLINAIIATEDSRYYQHNGFDLPRFIRASLGQALGNKGAGGASTISMQVVRNNFTSLEQNLIRKFTDIYLSIFKLEKKYTKEEILEFYVNTPFLGSNSYGVEQAARTFFNKSVQDVNLAEASLLAGLFQAPGAYDPYLYPERAEARRKTVLYLMRKHGYIDAEEEKIANSVSVESLLVGKGLGLRSEFQGYIDTVVAEVIDKTEHNPYVVPMKIYTNMDRAKQIHINKVMTGEIYTFENDVVQAGLALIDTHDGKIVAVGANRNITDERSFNFATMINRQPGSTAKPLFEYGPGMEYNNWSTYTPFLDDTYAYSDGGRIKNWDSKYMGLTTLRVALDYSRNIPALKAFQQVNKAKVIDFTKSLGLKPEISGNSLHEAHAIGGYNGTSPVEIGGAYAAFANGGYYTEPHSVNKIEYRESGTIKEFKYSRTKVMSESTAFMINDVLLGSIDRGFNSALRISGVRLAAKTGTTNFDDDTYRRYNLPWGAINDLWIIGYSPDYVLSFWYGYEKIDRKYVNNSGSYGKRNALFRTVANGVFEKNNKPFPTTNSVVRIQVEKETYPAMLPSPYTPENMIVSEYFKKGTEPTEISPRFNKITTDVANLQAQYISASNEFMITWDSVPAPECLTERFFLEHYKALYGNHINKYLGIYNTFNNSYLGEFGYNIYLENPTTKELTFIAFTKDNTYSHPAPATSATYVIKTGFSKLKANQSDGAKTTISYEPVEEETPEENPEENPEETITP